MGRKAASAERRLSLRHRAKQGAFAVLPIDLKMGPIEDISEEGLSFSYVPLGDTEHPGAELDIFFADDLFHLKNIPVETVSDCRIQENRPFSYLERRRRCLKFKTLSDYQKLQLRYFIRKYSEAAPSG